MKATEVIQEIQARLSRVYGPNHYYTRAYAPVEAGYWGQIPDWMLDYIAGQPCSELRVLDIGPGYGTLAAFSAWIQHNTVVCLDRVPFISPAAANMANVTMLLGDIERDNVPCFATKWDIVIMTEVLEHFNFHPLPTMRKIAASLTPTGRIFLSTPDAASWGKLRVYKELADIPAYDAAIHNYNNPPWRDQHIWQYDETELDSLMTAAGLNVLKYARSTSAGGVHFNLELSRG